MEMKTMGKGIKLYYDEEPYYGVTLDIWSTNKNDGNTREDFINNFKYAIKNNNWLQQNMNIGEVLDFLDTLSNNLNGDALYENLIDNFYYVESLHKNSFHLGISDSFNRVVFQNYHPYDNEETISIFGLLTPYLKNHNEFKEWFIHKLETKDKALYLSLLDSKESKKKLIAYKNTLLEQEMKNVNYYKKQLEEHENKANTLRDELEELENENNS